MLNADRGLEPVDIRKIFIGGLGSATTEATLKAYFKVWGDVDDLVIVKDRLTGCPRGFGFVIFSRSKTVDLVLSHSRHVIDGREVEVKRPQKKGVESVDARKIFIGGLVSATTEATLKAYFKVWGDVDDLVIVKDRHTGRPRGFGFVIFSRSKTVDLVLSHSRHVIDGREVEVKRSLKKVDVGYTGRNENKSMGPWFSVDAASINPFFKNECDVFAYSVAFQLKEMDQNQRIFAEKMISDVLYLGKVGQLTSSECHPQLHQLNSSQSSDKDQNVPHSNLVHAHGDTS